jgi:hypothetical protein
MNSLIKAMLSVDRRSKSVDSKTAKTPKLAQNGRQNALGHSGDMSSAASTHSIAAASSSSSGDKSGMKQQPSANNRMYLDIPQMDGAARVCQSYDNVSNSDDCHGDNGGGSGDYDDETFERTKYKSDTQLSAPPRQSGGSGPEKLKASASASAGRRKFFFQISFKLKKKFSGSSSSTSSKKQPKIKLFKSPSLSSIDKTRLSMCESYHSLSTNDLPPAGRRGGQKNSSSCLPTKIPIIQINPIQMVNFIMFYRVVS